MANDEKKVEVAAPKKTALSITIQPEQIMGAEVVRSGDYRYASMGVKLGENQFLRISYEWKGEEIPEFVMGLMGWMQANKEETDKAKADFAEEYRLLKGRGV